MKGVIYSHKDGKPLGRWQARIEPPAEDMKVIRQFLMQISKQKQTGEIMSESKDATNMCYLAGEIQTIKTREGGSAFLLVDVGPNSKFIPCTVFENTQLVQILTGFREGDFIQIVGFARAWSQKKNDEWRNSMDIRITQVKNKPPARPQQKSQKELADDEVPF